MTTDAPKTGRHWSSLQGIRIVIVLADLGMGGAERQALLLARLLKRDYQANVEIWSLWATEFTLGHEDVIPQRTLHLTEHASLPGRVTNLLRLRRALRQARADIVLPFTLAPNTLCGLVWRLAGARSCIWNQRDEGFARRPNLSERTAARLTPWFTSNSRRGQAFLRDTFRVADARLRVIDNGVEIQHPAQTREEWRKAIGVPDDWLLVCMVGHFQRAKDHETLLRAWRLVLDRFEPEVGAMLVLAGTSGDIPARELHALASELGLGERVLFLGYISNVPSVLAAVDVGVFSSLSEGSPNGVLECMAAGLAVVGTDIPAIAHAVGPNNQRYLVPARNAEALAERILELMKDTALRRQAGQLNKRRVEEQFSPDRMCDRYVELIAAAVRR